MSTGGQVVVEVDNPLSLIEQGVVSVYSLVVVPGQPVVVLDEAVVLTDIARTQEWRHPGIQGVEGIAHRLDLPTECLKFRLDNRGTVA